MPKRVSVKEPQNYRRADLFEPLTWINRQSYGQLKEWLRKAIRSRVFLPVVMPNNVMPASYLAQLFIKSNDIVKADLRAIVPQLIKEWGANDSPRCLDDLLILCGNLNCNEAEIAIGRVITEKLTNKPRDTELRLRALSVLLEIGTDKSLHIFKRYVGDFDYAAVCYRGLYLLNLNNAISELPNLIRLYRDHNAAEELEDVFKILFKYTLTSAEYICVLQPFVEEAPPDCFIEVFEILRKTDVLNEAFFIQLPTTTRADMIRQIMKRAREEDCDRISRLLNDAGLTLQIPPDSYPPSPFPVPKPEPKSPTATRQRFVPTNQGSFFVLNVKDESVPIITDSELGVYKTWAWTRSFTLDQNSIMSMLEGPPN